MVLPRSLLVSLGVRLMERLSFHLADERVEEYEVGEVQVRLDGRERTTTVVFGPGDTNAPSWCHHPRAFQPGRRTPCVSALSPSRGLMM